MITNSVQRANQIFRTHTLLLWTSLLMVPVLPAQIQLSSGVVQPISFSGFAVCTALPPSSCITFDQTYYLDVPATATSLNVSIDEISSNAQFRVYVRFGSSPTFGSQGVIADYPAVTETTPLTVTRATGLQTGRYFFRTGARIYVSQTVNVTGTLLVSLQTSAAYSIGGTVRDQSASPVAGVQLAVTGSSSGSTTTDANGDYSVAGLSAAGNYTLTPAKQGCTFNPASRSISNLAASQTGQDFTASCPSPSSGFHFIPITPCRVADTRTGQGKTGAFGPPTLPAGGTREMPIPQSACGTPESAKAYSLNITVIPKGQLSYLSTWPTGQPQPLVSTLNSFHGGVVANAAIVPAGTNGSISFFVTDSADLVVDINGYFDSSTSANALDFYPLAPCRAVDSRGGFSGQFGPPSLSGGLARTFPLLASSCGVAASARAYSLNATVVPPQPLSFLTLYPTGVAQPLVSTLNSFQGAIVANAAIVPGGNGGAINAFATDNTELVLDLNGYFSPPSTGSLKFFPLTPCRVADTRGAQGPILTGGSVRNFSIQGSCGVPSGARAYSLNVTVVPSQALAYLTLWPTGQGQPLVSTLNSFEGRVLANAAIVPAGTGGAVSVYVTNSTHVILDLNGYFAP